MAALIPAIGTIGLAHRGHVYTVHQWCRARFVADNADQPENGKGRHSKASFKSLGIQAQGRTTILKINYRNTQEVLELASGIASEPLKPTASDEDGIPLVAPISAGRHGPKPLLIKLPSIQEEAGYIAKHLKEAHKTGTPWSDMAVIYRDYGIGKPVLATPRKAGIPVTYQDNPRDLALLHISSSAQ
ncbi:MAG: hypothetical protein H6R15_2437 [Proteobacteria bacterium]|nr:hypothetical protein [Pseudomonadota bacterium]